MKSRKKIFICIIFSLIILLSIVGFAYSFFMTKISGNNSKSIVIQLGESEITVQYFEENDEYHLMTPGYTFYKMFTVTNTGNIPVAYEVFLEEIENEFVRTDDIVYSLYKIGYEGTVNANSSIFDYDDLSDCVEEPNQINENYDGTCYLVSTDTFPTARTSISDTETIKTSGYKYVYLLKYEYLNSEESQDIDKGHIFSGTVKVYGKNSEEANSKFDNGTLASAIYNNAENATAEQISNHYAELSATPKTAPAVDANTASEGTLSEGIDDFGTSYYFRGNVVNNYINFANMCWRIVRIEGDGSVKIVLEDQDTLCQNIDYSNGDGNWNIPSTTGGSTKTLYYAYDPNTYSSTYIEKYLNPPQNLLSRSLVTTFKIFQSGPLSNYLSDLRSGNWCYKDSAYTTTTGGTLINDRSTYYSNQTAFYYDSYVRLNGKTPKEPTFLCNGTTMDKYSDEVTDMYVATLTADEVMFAGGITNEGNTNYFLVNSYQQSENINFWTISPYYFYGGRDYVYYIMNNGKVNTIQVFYLHSARPSVVLKTGTEYNSGNGTIESPYTIK